MDRKNIIFRIVQAMFFAAIAAFIIISPYSKVVTKRAFLLILTFWIILGAISARLRFFWDALVSWPLSRAIGVFILVLTVSTIFGVNPYHSQVVLFNRYLFYSIICLLGFSIGRSQRNAYFLTLLFIAASVFIGYGGIISFLHSGGERLVRSFHRPVYFTQYLVLYFPLCISILFFAKKKAIRLLGLAGVVILYPCLILNSSRPAWVGVFLSIVAIFYLKNMKVLGLVLMVALILFMSFFPVQNSDRFVFLNTSTWGDRLDLWETALKIFKDHPLLGSGPGTYEKLLYTYGPAGGYSEGNIHLHAHNTYLELLSEVGIIGLTAFLFILLKLFEMVLKGLKAGAANRDLQAINLGLAAGVFSTLVLASATSIVIVDFQDAALFWFILGLVSGISSADPSKAEAQKPLTKSLA